MIFIEDIPNIKEILEKALKDLKSKEVKQRPVNNPLSRVVLTGAIVTGLETTSQDMKVESENLSIRLHKLDDYYDMIIYYNGEQVSYRTDNKEIDNLLAEIAEEFSKKCK